MTEPEWKDFMVFDISEDGDRTMLNIEPEDLNDYLHPEKVFTIIKQDINRIYLWKGGRSPVKKRFMSSRVATTIQGELMEAGFKRSKIVAIEQGDELQEFLNVFGLESMEVAENLEDKYYIRDIEKQKMKVNEILNTKKISGKTSKLEEIKRLLNGDEDIVWIKSFTVNLAKDWLKQLLKNKKFKDRLKNLADAKGIEIKNHESRYAITNKRIFVHSFLNTFFDFSKVPRYVLEIKGEIVILDLRELKSFEIEENETIYDVWFNVDPLKKGKNVFPFIGLTVQEYEKLIGVFENHFMARIPQKIKSLTYIRKKKVM